MIKVIAYKNVMKLVSYTRVTQSTYPIFSFNIIVSALNNWKSGIASSKFTIVMHQRGRKFNQIFFQFMNCFEDSIIRSSTRSINIRGPVLTKLVIKPLEKSMFKTSIRVDFLKYPDKRKSITI